MDLASLEVQRRKVLFAMEAHVNGQAQGFAAPRWLRAQGHHDEVKAQAVDYSRAGGPHGVPPPGRPLHVPTALVEEGIIQVQRDWALKRQLVESTLSPANFSGYPIYATCPDPRRGRRSKGR